MKSGFGDCRIHILVGIVNPVSAARKPASFGVKMGEGGHNRRGSRARDPVFEGNKPDIARLVQQPVICQRFDRENNVQVFRLRYPIK